MEKNEFFLKRIRELANLSYQRDIVTFSDFLNLNEQNMVSSLKQQFPQVVMETFGGYDNAERQMVAFHPDALAFTWEYPIDCLKIEPKAIKFSENLSHRDYMGALLNLGVDRSVIGDIIVQEKAAWFFCQSKMTEFFLENLCRVRHTNILITKVNDPEEFPHPNLESINGTCASVRLDSLIALAFKASRSSMVSYIESGQVFVNGKLITSNGYEPKEGDIVSVRGKGRFIFDGVSHQTKKGRCGVHILLYV
ncbi:MAG: YlmH/Sll1252 family protein [Blautia sp.]|uniref:YlmH family RNA-binding protein n=1 Tax=Blautia sp. TaxID=1955243 RepID=UPI0025B9360E|nr:YlmH/Sll1252 family protein [Blautia sp.]MCI7450189.1 YlmH/Sll1252 family protein [Blautia sp.]MDD6415151.1 YlmH/Sll1252 family protein [Blautia sp.]